MSNSGTAPFLSPLGPHAADPFRLLIESVVDYAIVMLDPAGNVASWNPGAERLYGYRAEEIIGLHVSRLHALEAAAAGAPAEALNRARQNGNHEQECLRLRKDGATFWSIITTSDLRDPLGKHVGFAELTRDVTDRKRAEAAMRSELYLSAAILDSLPGVYYMFDRRGRFLRWNRQFEAVTEYSAEEIARMHPLDFFKGEDKQRITERIENVFRSGADEVEADFVSRSGRRTPYYFNGVRAEIDGETCLLGMGIDISRHKRAEHALHETDQRLRQAASAANVGLWDWDMRTGEVFFSREWKRQIGYEEHEIGTSFEEWRSRVHPDDLEPAIKRMAASAADPSNKYDAEFRVRHRDGSYRWIVSQASLRCDEQGTPIRMLGSHVDVTEQRQLERQLQQAQKMEAIGRLAGGVAHDFNNLLTVINGYSELLLARLGTDDPVRKAVVEIHKAGNRAGALTRQLLVFSRRDAHEQKVLDLNAIVAGTEQMLRRMIGADVMLATHLAPSLWQVKADPGHIEQVLMNLAVNSRDAMPDGGRLTIETRNTTLDEHACRAMAGAAPGDYVLLSVSDTGCGMEEATRAQIFEPFFTTKEVGKGTGLGLAIVHGIAKQSNGHIAVRSEPGQGTTFHLYLPRTSEALAETTAAIGSDEMPEGTETVLLVEDEDVVRAMVRHILQTCGYHVIEAADGLEAMHFAQARQGPIHLLISDVVMPHLSGRSLAEQLSMVHPECKVLFISGYAGNNVIPEAGEFLQKPFTPAVLAQKVRGILDDSHSSC